MEFAVTIPAVVGAMRSGDGRIILRVVVLPGSPPTLLYLTTGQAKMLAADLEHLAAEVER